MKHCLSHSQTSLFLNFIVVDLQVVKVNTSFDVLSFCFLMYFQFHLEYFNKVFFFFIIINESP